MQAFHFKCPLFRSWPPGHNRQESGRVVVNLVALICLESITTDSFIAFMLRTYIFFFICQISQFI